MLQLNSLCIKNLLSQGVAYAFSLKSIQSIACKLLAYLRVFRASR